MCSLNKDEIQMQILSLSFWEDHYYFIAIFITHKHFEYLFEFYIRLKIELTYA